MILRTLLILALLLSPALPSVQPQDREAVYLKRLSDRREHEKLDKLILAINKSRQMLVQTDGLPPESRRMLYRQCAEWLEDKAKTFRELENLK